MRADAGVGGCTRGHAYGHLDGPLCGGRVGGHVGIGGHVGMWACGHVGVWACGHTWKACSRRCAWYSFCICCSLARCSISSEIATRSSSSALETRTVSEVSAPPSASLRDERSREAVPSPSISNMKIWPSSLAVKRGGSVCVWACAGMGVGMGVGGMGMGVGMGGHGHVHACT